MPVGHDVYYDDPPHPVTVSVYLQSSCPSSLLTLVRRRALQNYKGTKVNTNLTSTASPGLPSTFQFLLIHLGSSNILLQFLYVASHPPLPFLACTYSPSHCASNQEVPNDHPHIHVPQLPLPYDIAEPSQRNPSIIQSEMSVDEDLKTLASRYLHSPSSFIDKLRMRRNRSGAVMVLILLKIDGQYAPANQAAIHVRVLSKLPTLPSPPCIYSLSYYTFNCRRCPTTDRPFTLPLLTAQRGRLEDSEIPVLYILECQLAKTLKTSRATTFTILAHLSTSFG